MGNVIVLGSLITDLVARAPRLPLPGESLIGDEFATFLGGKGFNQAVAAARLGAKVTLIGRTGSDAFGDAFFSVFEEEGINSQHVQRDPTIGTGVACVMIAASIGQNAIIVLPRANSAITAETVDEAMQSILAPAALPGETNIFMAQCEMRMATIVTGLRIARNAGMTTILNAAPIPREPLEEDLFTFVDILIVNESEAATLAGMDTVSIETSQKAAEQLLARGSKHVIITLGAQGSAWCTRKATGSHPSHQWIPAFPVTAVDATAAGDAFCGALAAGLAQGMEMATALHRASAAGAITATRMGAYPSLPIAAEVEEALRKARA